MWLSIEESDSSGSRASSVTTRFGKQRNDYIGFESASLVIFTGFWIGFNSKTDEIFGIFGQHCFFESGVFHCFMLRWKA